MPPEGETDWDKPPTNHCASCGVGINSATGLCSDCAETAAQPSNGNDS